MEFSEYCRSRAEAECRQVFEGACFSKDEKDQFGSSEADCIKNREQQCLELKDAVNDGRLEFNGDAAEKCIDRLKVVSCEDYKNQLYEVKACHDVLVCAGVEEQCQTLLQKSAAIELCDGIFSCSPGQFEYARP